MECGTISQLSSHFETRFEVLKTAFKLNVCAGKYGEELDEMKTNLQEIKKILRELQNTVDGEKQDLQHAKEALASLQRERGRVEHLLAHVPDRLPSSVPPPAPQPPTDRPAGELRPAAAARVSAPPSVACLTVSEFAAVPQYMRGRGSRDQANRLLDEVNAVLAARYALLRRPRASLQPKEKKLWLECKREETAETKGKQFFTEDDFKRFNKTSLSKGTRQLLVVLRHVGRIKTVRGAGTLVRHVLC
ncbi:spindle and kinetochore-associated protein 1-like [Pollicipes pollicipes]|uniref:spindle and kinetochore-associated protein 1-like n=1 Tax=Pollicipes pollicipes TaxID=41117 RepID=UPI001884E944|nr:spindle and kinetochore-associated protein 1-like [Pollicipes pollicipes]